MAKKTTTAEDASEAWLSEEKRRDTEYAEMFLHVFQANDIEKLPALAARLSNESIDGWRIAFKKLVRMAPPSDEFRQSFFRIWIQNKSIQREVANDHAQLQD